MAVEVLVILLGPAVVFAIVVGRCATTIGFFDWYTAILNLVVIEVRSRRHVSVVDKRSVIATP